MPSYPGETFRSRVFGKLLRGTLTGLSRAARAHPQADPARHNVRVVQDVPYIATGDASHLLDVYIPTVGEGPFPVVMYVHGGAFQILSKETHFAMALAFARRGYVVFNVNYRLAPQNKFPRALEDLSHAYEWLSANASKYNADLSRLVLAGDSAGANLVTSLTLMACDERSEPYAKRIFDLRLMPIAVLPTCGILQVSNPERLQARLKRATWAYDRVVSTSRSYLDAALTAEEQSLADPLLILESDRTFARALPPFFVGAGTRDPVLDDSRRLIAALDKRKVPCVGKIYPGGIHTFHAFVWRNDAKAFWRDTYAFLDTYAPNSSAQ